MAYGVQKHLVATPYQDRQEFTGNLFIGADPVLISAPKGTMIKSVLAQVGDQVRRGETLVVLDKNLLFEKQAQFQEQLQIAQYKRDCFAQNAAPAIPKPQKGSDDKTLQADLKIAAQSCRTDLGKLQAPITQLAAQLANLQKRTDLIAKQLILQAHTGDSAAGAQNGKNAQIFLSLMLAQNELEQKINKAQAKLTQAELVAKTTRAAQADQFSTQVASLQSTLANLKQNLRSPRIAAPAAGTYLPVDETILELQPIDAPDYRVQVFTPRSIVPRLRADHAVEFRVLGLGLQSPPLPGRIIKPDQARPDNTVALWVQPDQDALNYLDQQLANLALAQGISASAVTVRLSDRPLWPIIQRGVSQLWMRAYVHNWLWEQKDITDQRVNSDLS